MAGGAAPCSIGKPEMPISINEEWWVNDQTPDNPFGKSEDYEAFLDYVGALNRSLTPEIAAEPLRINVEELNDHPEYQDAAIGALQMWASVTPLEFEIVSDTPWDRETDWIRVVSPELGEQSDGTPSRATATSASASASTTPSPTSPTSAATSTISTSTSSATSSA